MIKIVTVTDIHNNCIDFDAVVDRVIDKTEDFASDGDRSGDLFRHEDLNLFVITGDIQDDPEAEFEGVLVTEMIGYGIAKLEEAGFSVMVVPGNHDVGRAGIFYSSSAKKFFNQQFCIDEYPYHIEFPEDGLCVIGVDSTAGSDDTILAAGEITKKQLDRIDQILSETECKHKVILMHHHPVKRAQHKDAVGMELVDAAKYQKIARRNGVTVTIHGHRHSYQGLYRKEGILTFTPGKLSGDKFAMLEIRDNGMIFSTLGV